MGRPVMEQGARRRPRVAPLPLPANDNRSVMPLRRVPPGPRVPTLRKPPTIPAFGPRLAPGWGTALSIGESLDNWLWYPNPNPYRVTGPWYHAHWCGRWPGSPPYNPNAGNIGPAALPKPAGGHIINCLAGQVPGTTIWLTPYTEVSSTIVSGASTLFIADIGLQGVAQRARHDDVWHKAGGTGVQPYTVTWAPAAAAMPAPNPNVIRWTLTEPLTRPQAEPGLLPDGLPLLLEAALELLLQLPERTYPGQNEEIGGMLEIGTGVAPSPQHPPLPGHARKPPGKGVRERKTLSKSKKIGIALFGALDAVSETSEAVSAIYDSLPDATKKANPCDRSDFGIDQAGQYGIDNVDCKIAAIAANWSQVDGAKAWKGIAANLLEDQIHGFKHRLAGPLDKYLGGSQHRGDKAFGKLLNDLLDAMFGD